MKKTKIEGKVTMFQIVANHDHKAVQVTQIATKQDLFLMFGCAFENDPDLLQTIREIVNLYVDFKMQEIVH